MCFADLETEPVLVDSPETRRKIVEFEQLSIGYDTGPGWRRRHSRTHSVQGAI